MSFVVDASALVYASITEDPEATRLRRRLREESVHAPHLIDAELGNVLRRHVLRGAMSEDHADAVLHLAPQLVDHRYDHTGSIAAVAWSLRENLTFYDAIYVALAAALGVSLVTADRRLSNAPGLLCCRDVVRQQPGPGDACSRGERRARSTQPRTRGMT